MATTKADKTETTTKAVKRSELEDRGEEIVGDDYPYEAPPSAIPQGASKPQGEKVSQVSGGGEPSEAPLADHHDVAYRDRDPGIMGSTGSVTPGGSMPGKRVIETEGAGTLVENFPDMREQGRTTMNSQPVEHAARQPGESDEAYKERTSKK